MSSYAVKVVPNGVHVVDIKSGAIKRSIPGDAVNAQLVDSNTVQVTHRDGKVRVYDITSGALKRSI